MKKILVASLALFFVIVGCKDEGPEPIPPVPIVSITSMSGTANIVDSTVVEIGATDDKGIIRVELYLNNTLDTSRIFIRPPYRWAWSVKHLPDSSLHTFFARAYDADGNVSTSPVVVARVLRFMPNSLTLSFLNDTAAVLQWRDPSSIESGFEIEESSDGINFVHRVTVPSDTTYAVLLDSFYNDSSYYYRVRAITPGRGSDYSNIVGEKIEFIPPVNLRITYMDEDTAQIEWDDPHTFAQRYIIETRTDESPWTRVLIVQGNERKARIWNTYQTFKTYFFRIQPRSNINIILGQYSNVASSPLIFPAPDSLVVTYMSDDEVRLQWRDNANFGSFFEIERQTDEGPFLQAKTVPRSSKTASISFAYQKNRTYTFRVYSRTNLNTTDYSNKVKIFFRDEIFTGGSFDQAGSEYVSNIAKWNGAEWGGIGEGIEQPIFSMRKYFERIFIGGKRTITAWDNKNYSTIVGSLADDDEYIYSMIDTNGRLIAGGVFAHLGSAMNGVGEFTGTNWTGLGTGMNGPVYAVSYFNNNVIAAGKFTTASNKPINNIAKRTSTWDSIGTGLPSTIYSLMVYNNELWAGGSFRDTARNLRYLAKWNTLAEQWLPVTGAGMTTNDSIRVYTMTIYNNELYVAGRFSSIDGVAANNIAKWNGSTWEGIGSGVDGVVRFLYVFNNVLYVGGRFTTAGGFSASNIASWNGADWAPLGTGVKGSNATVYSMGTYGSWYWDNVIP